MSVRGTFRTWRDVRIESDMRTKADVRQRLWFYGFKPSWTTSSLTFAIPPPTIPSVWAAEYETSTTRPAANGPWSWTRTVTDCQVATFVTRNRVPNGNVR